MRAFGRAALRLGIAQPSLTQQIAALEQAIGHAARLVVHRKRLMIALPPRHPLGSRRAVTWRQLKSERFVLFPR